MSFGNWSKSINVQKKMISVRDGYRLYSLVFLDDSTWEIL